MHETAQAATELTISAPDQPGELAKILTTLAESSINIRAYTAYVDGDRGYLKVVPSDPDAAVEALCAAGYHYTVHEVITVVTEDAIGSAAQVASAIAASGLSIGHSHASSPGSGSVLLVFNTSDNEKALTAVNG